MWEDTKQRVSELKEVDRAGASLAPRDYELIQLLADAEALLAVAQAIRAYAYSGPGGNLWETVMDNLAALPAYLREQGEG